MGLGCIFIQTKWSAFVMSMFSNVYILCYMSRCTEDVTWIPTQSFYLIGNVEVTGECSKGYYCTLAAESATPTDGISGNECGLGDYCPTGSSAGTSCPTGTFNNITGLTNYTECEPCTPGYYCSQLGMSSLSGVCHAGHYIYWQYVNVMLFHVVCHIVYPQIVVCHHTATLVILLVSI